VNERNFRQRAQGSLFSLLPCALCVKPNTIDY